jgi:hypothetical protein
MRAIRRFLLPFVLPTLVTSLVLSRMEYCNFGLPASSINRLQTVQNAAARLIYNIRRTKYVTDSVICLHWFRVAERILFKMAAAMTYRSINGLPPPYTYSVSLIIKLRLSVSQSRPFSIGNGWFPVAGANVWNEVPSDVTLAPSLSTFRSRLKTHLLRFSYTDLVI